MRRDALESLLMLTQSVVGEEELGNRYVFPLLGTADPPMIQHAIHHAIHHASQKPRVADWKAFLSDISPCYSFTDYAVATATATAAVQRRTTMRSSTLT